MASLRSSCCSSLRSGQLEQALRCIAPTDTSQQSAASSGPPRPLDSTQQCCNVPPGNCPEDSVIGREALRMHLPAHLVLTTMQRRLQTHGTNYTDVKELVVDLFAPDDRCCSRQTREVPMETNQLEEALMMNSLVVRKALQRGVPPHLIKPKVRAKILSNRVGYADVDDLLKDLNTD